MKLLISIEYRTRWGEQFVMRIGKRRIALQYADGGVWTGAIERYTQSEDTEYRYEIERDGACIRSEWRPHTLRLPAREGVRTLRIRDRWQEMPSDTPFYSSAFTRGIFGRGKPAVRRRLQATSRCASCCPPYGRTKRSPSPAAAVSWATGNGSSRWTTAASRNGNSRCILRTGSNTNS